MKKVYYILKYERALLLMCLLNQLVLNLHSDKTCYVFNLVIVIIVESRPIPK